MSLIARSSDLWVGALSNVLANTPAVPFTGYAGAVLLLPAAYASTSIEVYTSDSDTGTFVPLYSADGNQVTLTVGASRAVTLPAACYACRYLKLKTSADDTSRTVTLSRKG